MRLTFEEFSPTHDFFDFRRKRACLLAYKRLAMRIKVATYSP
jgi:hypothetical protein